MLYWRARKYLKQVDDGCLLIQHKVEVDVRSLLCKWFLDYWENFVLPDLWNKVQHVFNKRKSEVDNDNKRSHVSHFVDIC